MVRDIQTRRAFTLIELLVVLTVIALLAALLFPVFVQARNKAMQAACLSNLRQIGLGLAMYTQDHDSKLMPGNQIATLVPNSQTHYIGWAGACNLYVHSARLFRCPVDDTADSVILGEPGYPLSYFFNLNLGAENVPDGLPETAFAAPDKTVVVAESTGGPPGLTARLDNPNEVESRLANFFTRVDGFPYNRHQNGRDFLMADGHVKWFHPGQVSTGPLSQAVPPESLPPGYSVTFAYQ